MVTICMFLIISGAQNLFMCLLVIYISSLKKCLFKTFAYFKNQLAFLLLSYIQVLVSPYTINPFSYTNH